MGWYKPQKYFEVPGSNCRFVRNTGKYALLRKLWQVNHHFSRNLGCFLMSIYIYIFQNPNDARTRRTRLLSADDIPLCRHFLWSQSTARNYLVCVRTIADSSASGHQTDFLRLDEKYIFWSEISEKIQIFLFQTRWWPDTEGLSIDRTSFFFS